MKRLAVDTSVAVHWIASAPKPGQDADWRAAQAVLALDDEWEMVLPAPALAEILTAVAEPQRQVVAEALSRRMVVLPCDFEAAIWAARFGRPSRSAESRQAAKVDHLIAGTTIRWGVDAFCTADDALARACRRVEPQLRVGGPQEFLKGRTLDLFPG